MSNQQFTTNPQEIRIELEIVPEDDQLSNDTDVEEVSREVVDYLRSSGYTVEPAYTGIKGNPVFEIVIHIYKAIHDNEALLAAIFTSLPSILQCIMKVRDRRAEREKTHRAPLEVTLEVDGEPMTIKSSDAESVSNLLKQLHRAQSEGPMQDILPISLKTKVQVPKKKRYRGH